METVPARIMMGMEKFRMSASRKIRNRLRDMGESLLVQSDERRDDAYRSIKDRVDANAEVQEFAKGKKTNNDLYAQAASKAWIDVRSFGQVFAFSGAEASSGVSIGVRGPVRFIRR